MKRSFMALAAALSFVAAGVWAPPISAHEKSHACRVDIEQFCKDVKPGQGRIAVCLKDHSDQLSPRCQEHMKKAQARREACKADSEKFCSGIQPGHGRIRDCLKEHKSKLSSECRVAFKK